MQVEEKKMNQPDVFDVTIIGGGPIGLFAAFYSGLRGMKTKVIEALPQLGGQLMALYPEKAIYDVAGFPEVRAKVLAEQLIEQASRYNPEYVLGERAVQMKRNDDGLFVIQTDKGSEHYSRTVIISAGIGAFKPNTLDRPGVKEFEGKGVYYFAKSFEEFRDKRVLIVGGGDSAVDWALNLHPIARSTMLIHRRTGFRAHEESVKELFESPVTVKLHWELKEIRGDDRVREVTIFNNQTQDEETHEVDAVILALGFKADIGPIAEWGLELEGRHIKVNVRMETNIPGVFACGDVVSVEGLGNMKLLATGFGQAAIAVGGCKHFIDPSAKIFGGHSSEMVPKQEQKASSSDS